MPCRSPGTAAPGPWGSAASTAAPLKRLADLCIVVPVDSTPQVESLHLAVHHLICDRLRQRIAAA